MEEVKRIPFAKPYIDKDAWKEMGEELISNGEWCRKAEETVAKISGADYGIICGSCTQAMLMGLGVASATGDCWTQSFTWMSTPVASGIGGLHAQVKLVEDTYLVPKKVIYREIDPERWCAKDYNVPLQGRKGYALVVDTFGMQYNPESRLPVFYDRAHSLGVRFSTLGAFSFLSFSPSKIITCGEGGMMLTNLTRYVKAATNARDLISRMDEARARMLCLNLRKLPDMLEWKRKCRDFYEKKFPMCQFQRGEGNNQVIGMLMESKEQRDRVFNALEKKIEFKAYYEALHLRNPESPPLRITEDVASRILCVPSWYKCPREEVAENILEVLET